MAKRKFKDTRRQSRRLKELQRDTPFGVGSQFSWDDSNIAYDDWGGENELHDDDDDDDDWYEQDADPLPLDFS